MKTVLVPLDGSTAAETVLPYVELLASRTASEVILMTVVPEREESEQTGEALAYLERTAEELRERSLTCRTAVAAGTEAQTILDEADARDAGLIAMSTHGRSGLMRWVLGSVVQKVIHGASRPLLVVRGQDDGQRPVAMIDRIVVPLDGSPLSMGVVPFAEEVAEALGAALVLYNAVPPLDIYPGMEMTPARVGSIVDDLVAQGQAFLRAVAGEIEGRGKVKVHTVVTIGFPVDETVRLAAETKAGLIAMATHGRSGLNRWVMGSAADGIVRRSELPVLLVRPEQAEAEEG